MPLNNPNPLPAVVVIPKNADQIVNNSIVPVNAADLFLYLDAFEVWSVELKVLCQSPTALPDIRIVASFPAACDAYLFWLSTSNQGAGLADVVRMFDVPAGAPGVYGILHYIIINGINPGNFQIQFCQNNAQAEDTTLLKNSCLIATRIA